MSNGAIGRTTQHGNALIAAGAQWLASRVLLAGGEQRSAESHPTLNPPVIHSPDSQQPGMGLSANRAGSACLPCSTGVDGPPELREQGRLCKPVG